MNSQQINIKLIVDKQIVLNSTINNLIKCECSLNSKALKLW